jgi:hypothetical protein
MNETEIINLYNFYTEALSSIASLAIARYEDGETVALGCTRTGGFVSFPYSLWEFYIALREETLDHTYLLDLDYEKEDDPPSSLFLLGEGKDFKIINLI